MASTGRRIWIPFAVLLLLSLVLLWLVQVPLAWRLARRLRRSQEDRETLLVRALEASDDERRRIAADLHDGVVQDLAGVSYSLSATAERVGDRPPTETRSAVREAAGAVRDAMRRLRSVLVEIHPPNLRASGLAAALADVVAPLEADDIETTLTGADEPLPEDVERLFYRAAGEAIRNIRLHAGASKVTVDVSSTNGIARLEVVDDGAGFTAAERERSRAEGHVGLSLLEELAARMGGRLEVVSTPGTGTSFELEVPSFVIRVVIADDHGVVRQGLAQLLSTFTEIELAGQAADGDEAVALCSSERPDVVLMDLEMPGVDGIEATRRIKAELPDIAVVVLTSFSDRERILQAIDAGAAGYLLKDVEPAELVKAIESAARGDAPLDPRAARTILGARRAAAPAAELSDREREVLTLVAEGLPNKLIARRLEISEKTVKAHLTSVFKQIGVTDRTQAALWAERNGFTRES